MKGTNYVPKAVLDETLIMEQISKPRHPNIIGAIRLYAGLPAARRLPVPRGPGIGRGLPAFLGAYPQRHQPGQHHDQGWDAGAD